MDLPLCHCGSKPTLRLTDKTEGRVAYQCPKCDRGGVSGETEAEAYAGWAVIALRLWAKPNTTPEDSAQSSAQSEP
jgi:hypothetical protein